MDSPTAPYNVIVGRDVLDKYKFIVDFDAKLIRWGDLAAHMRRHDQLHRPVHLPSPLEPDDPAFNTFYTTVDGKIKPAKYEAVSIDDVIKQQDHLDQQQKRKASTDYEWRYSSLLWQTWRLSAQKDSS
jgi:hypothetical protein